MEGISMEDYERFSQRRREAILSRVAGACASAGRDVAEVDVVAVSKTVDVPGVVASWRAGWRHFAENRPQELVRKLAGLAELDGVEPISFDMIGNLQKNKINQVVGRVRKIHSISGEALAQDVAKRSLTHAVISHVLLEVNVSGEQSKSGMTPDEAREAFGRIMELEGIEVEGLMTMAPAHDADAARRTFCGLRELRDELERHHGVSLPTLSCGMSDDFPIAIEEGSTLVRLGRVAFDPAYPFGN